jgi:exodeoxyribonuclease VII small subunit
MNTKQTPVFNFEKALAKLAKTVENMEKGGLSLEASLQEFEQGVALARQCQQVLAEAEQKIEILLKNSDDVLVNFNLGDDNS